VTTPLYDPARDRFRLSVARTIKAARIAAGLSQRKLAEMADLSHAMIVSIEDGHSLCSLWAASQIAEALDTSIDALAPVLIDERKAAE
jgi:DNA-binding XRE family transcriptional regulator